MTDTSIGMKVLDAIADGALVAAHEDEQDVLIWSANAAEQLTALIDEQHKPTDINARLLHNVTQFVCDAFESRQIPNDAGEPGPLNAAFIGQALKLLDRLEGRPEPGATENPFEAIAAQMSAARDAGGDIPPINDEDDQATR